MGRKKERKSDIERQADELLRDELKDKRKNKSRIREYPILSDTQLDRVYRHEIPYSELSAKQRQKMRNKNHDIPEPE